MIFFSTKRKKYALKGGCTMQKNRIRTCNFSMRLSELDATVLDAKKDEYNNVEIRIPAQPDFVCAGL